MSHGRVALYLFDARTGKVIGDQTFQHTDPIKAVTIEQVSASQLNALATRTIAFLDAQADLFLLPLSHGHLATSATKIGANIASIHWSSQSSLLVGTGDQRLITWLWPSSIFTDAQFSGIRTEKESPLIKYNTHVVSISEHDRQTTLRTSDGVRLHFALDASTSIASTLAGLAHQQQWAKCLKLCWFIQDKQLWKVLAILAVQYGDLRSAEYAYSALQAFIKSGFMRHAQNLSKAEARQAYLALFRGQLQEAEGILVSAGLVYQAIMMCADVGVWDR